jgi:glutaredoxin
MFDYLPLNESPAKVSRAGAGSVKQLVLIGLSTCAFCRRAKLFLESEGLPFRWVYLDEVDPALKRRAKSEFSTRFNSPLTFPALVIDDSDFLPGFIEPSWRKELLSYSGKTDSLY